MLDNPNEPVSDLSYFDCIESVMENSKVSLTVLLASLPTVGRNRDVLCVRRPGGAHVLKGSWCLCPGVSQS